MNFSCIVFIDAFQRLKPVVDSTSKFPRGEQGPWLEEHPLSWGSCLESRLMLYSAGICSGVTVDSGSSSLYSKHIPLSTLTREEVRPVSQLWDKEEERVLLQSSGTMAQPRRLSCCVS